MTDEERKTICSLNINKIRYNYDCLFYDQLSCVEIEREMYLKYGDLWKLARFYNNNYFKKRCRINKRIKSICDSVDKTNDIYAYFLTLTFTDDVLNKTQKHIRRKYVQSFCKNNFIDYIANVDYGDLKGREHYHAVVLTDNIATWNYGFYKYEKIRLTEVDKKRISKYVSKLTNHAMKVYGKADRLIFSRKKRKD